MKREVCGFFRKRFVEDLHVRPDLDCYGLKQVDENYVLEIVLSFVGKEIKDAVF